MNPEFQQTKQDLKLSIRFREQALPLASHINRTYLVNSSLFSLGNTLHSRNFMWL